ncbi:MAG: molybdate ABC transporter substrate-binding protein [Halobacteriota archaeon]
MDNHKRVLILLCAVISAVAIAACGCMSPTQTTQSGKLTVFAAASLTDAFNEIGRSYQANHTDTNISFNFGGSQVLRTQIEQGARADVFASANLKQMNALKDQGLMNNSSITVFAKNKLAIIVPAANPANITNLSDLARSGIKLVVGTKDVPCGDYTIQMLNNTANVTAYGPDFKNRTLANVVSQEPNVNGIVTKVALGEADAGIVYVSDVPLQYKDKVQTIAIPDSVNVVAQYPIGVLSGTKNAQEAQSFIDFVKSPAGQTILQKYGFIVVYPLTQQTATTHVAVSAQTT